MPTRESAAAQPVSREASTTPERISPFCCEALATRVLNHIDNESQCFKIKNYMKDRDVVNKPYVNHSVIDKINGITSGRGTVTQDASVINTGLDRRRVPHPLS